MKKLSPREINSIEWYEIIVHEKKGEEKFAHYDTLFSDPYIFRLDDGRTFIINDDPPTTNRRRSLEELKALHLTEEEWEEGMERKTE